MIFVNLFSAVFFSLPPTFTPQSSILFGNLGTLVFFISFIIFEILVRSHGVLITSSTRGRSNAILHRRYVGNSCSCPESQGRQLGLKATVGLNQNRFNKQQRSPTSHHPKSSLKVFSRPDERTQQFPHSRYSYYYDLMVNVLDLYGDFQIYFCLILNCPITYYI